MPQVSTKNGAAWRWCEYGDRPLAYSAFLKRMRKGRKLLLMNIWHCTAYQEHFTSCRRPFSIHMLCRNRTVRQEHRFGSIKEVNMPTVIERIRHLVLCASPSGLMLSAVLLLMACGLSDDPHTPVSAAADAKASPTARDAADTPTAQPRGGSANAPLSLTETETLLRSHTATLLSVSSDQIQLVEAVARTWPDRGLGCGARRGVYEPQPTPGYMIVLSHGTTTLRYHADQYGRFIRCDETSRPRGPIR